MGTELLNKVTTAIQIAPAKASEGTGIFEVKFLKTRNSKLTEHFYVRYGERERNLIVVSENEVKKTRLKRVEAPIHEILPLLAEGLQEGRISSKELMARLHERFGTSEKTIRERLSSIMENKVIVVGSGSDRLYLNREQPGREAFYFLK
jgi:predicted HTH transcriptional regulator